MKLNLVKISILFSGIKIVKSLAIEPDSVSATGWHVQGGQIREVAGCISETAYCRISGKKIW